MLPPIAAMKARYAMPLRRCRQLHADVYAIRRCRHAFEMPRHTDNTHTQYNSTSTWQINNGSVAIIRYVAAALPSFSDMHTRLIFCAV